MAITLTNQSPTVSAVNVLVDSSISFTIADSLHQVIGSSVQVRVSELLAYSAGSWQSGYSGTVVANGNGFDVSITPDDDLPHGTAIEIIVEADNVNSESARLTYSFNTIINLYYNVYYAPSGDPEWIIANANPLVYERDGNEYTITGLEQGVLYQVAVIPLRKEDGEYLPVISQPIGNENRGAGGINVVNSYPYYIIKTTGA